MSLITITTKSFGSIGSAMLTSSISNFGFNVQWTVDSWKSRCPSFSPRSQSAQKSNMTQNVLDLIDLTNLFISEHDSISAKKMENYLTLFMCGSTVPNAWSRYVDCTS